MPQRNFTPVIQCCRRNCCIKVDAVRQEAQFNHFYAIGEYEKQNIYLAGLMTSMEMKQKKVNPVLHNRQAAWKYIVKEHGVSYVVCKKILLSILLIKPKRFFCLQRKLLVNSVLQDGRRKHKNPKRIKKDVWTLLEILCQSLPHVESHYSYNKTKRLYFTNPELTLSKLLEMFRDYYLCI